MMLPKAEAFAKYVQDIAGIENHHHVVLYDNHKEFIAFSAARVWWMFRVFGHSKVSVLEGGLPSWINEGLGTVSGEYGKEEAYPGNIIVNTSHNCMKRFLNRIFKKSVANSSPGKSSLKNN